MKYYNPNPISAIAILLIIAQTSHAQLWEHISTSSRSIQSLSFVSKDTGYACAMNEVILKTTDAGASWQEIHTGSISNHLYEIKMVSSRVGYAVGRDILLKTSDYGESWVQTMNGVPPNDLDGIYCWDENTVIVVGESGGCWKTSDGGSTWISKITGTTSIILESVFFVQDTVGYIVGYAGELLKSVDGGENWQDLGYLTLSYLQDVYFHDANNGIVVGFDASVFITSNGGTSWQPISTGATGVTFTSVQFTDSNTGYITGNNGYILKTTDGGNTWKRELAGAAGTISDLVAYDGLLLAAGSNGKILRYNAQGLNDWTNASRTVNDTIADVFFVDDQTGFIATCASSGTHYLHKTNDGGLTWQHSCTSTSRINAIHFTGPSTGLLACNKGKIYKTTDGGVTWNEKGTIVNDIDDIKFFGKDTGVVVQKNGQVAYFTYDAGESWNTAVLGGANPDYKALTAVAFASKSYIFAVGDEGTLIQSNGLMLWAANGQQVTAENLTDIVFPTYTTGYIVGENGLIMKTTNTGVTWTRQAIGNNYGDFSAVHFMDALNGYVAGKSGLLLKTTDGGTTWTPVDLKLWHKLTALHAAGTQPVVAGEHGLLLVKKNILAAQFAVINQTGNNPVTVSFQDESHGEVTSWFWAFSDGQFSNQQNPTNKYYASGNYQVCLTVSNETKNLFNKYCERVNVVVGGTGVFSADFGISSTGNVTDLSFSNTSTIGASKFYWEFGDGNISFDQHPNHSYAANGIYAVTLHVYNDTTDCMDVYKSVVQVGELYDDCEADFDYEVNLNTNKVRFFNTSLGTDLSSYTWDFGTGATSTETNPSYTYPTGNYYMVCLTAKSSTCNNITCKKVKASNNVDFCAADYIYTVDQSANRVYFSNRSAGDYTSRAWDFGDGQSATQANPSHDYSAPGMYLVTLKVRNPASGCMNFKSMLVDVHSGKGGLSCSYAYMIDSTYHTKGVLPIEFDGAAFGDPSAIEWDFGDGQTNTTTISPTHTYGDTGNYTACLTVFDEVTSQEDTHCKEVKAVSDADTTVRVVNRIPNLPDVQLYPNPVKHMLIADYALNVAGLVEIRIYDLTGRKMITSDADNKASGQHHQTMDVSQLPSGLYYIKLLVDGHQVVKKIIKL